MKPTKSNLRRTVTTAFLGALVAGILFTATEAEATHPGKGFHSSIASRGATNAAQRARSRAIEVRFNPVKRDRLGELGVDHSGLGDGAAGAAPAREKPRGPLRAFFARLFQKS